MTRLMVNVATHHRLTVLADLTVCQCGQNDDLAACRGLVALKHHLDVMLATEYGRRVGKFVLKDSSLHATLLVY